MGGDTKIEWTDKTLNFATGCTKVSPGCDHCYMYRQWPRLQGMNVPGYNGRPEWVNTNRATQVLNQIDLWKKPRRIFINSMSDTFHKKVPFEYVRLMLEKARNNPRHTLQVLTKRPGRAVAFWKWLQDEHGWFEWPPNVWLGTSVESAKYLPRLDVLARVPAKVLFVSCEPLLSALDLRPWLQWETEEKGSQPYRHWIDTLSWVIVGGESGPGAQPMHPQWARDIRGQCQETGVPFFFKQWGEWRPLISEPYIRGSKAIGLDGTIGIDVHADPMHHYMAKVGKKAAGALLDGQEWREVPR